jgi:hypothetical protein
MRDNDGGASAQRRSFAMPPKDIQNQFRGPMTRARGLQKDGTLASCICDAFGTCTRSSRNQHQLRLAHDGKEAGIDCTTGILNHNCSKASTGPLTKMGNDPSVMATATRPSCSTMYLPPLNDTSAFFPQMFFWRQNVLRGIPLTCLRCALGVQCSPIARALYQPHIGNCVEAAEAVQISQEQASQERPNVPHQHGNARH